MTSMNTIKTIDVRLLQDLTARAAAAPRRRTNHNLHPGLDDPVQRFCNAIEPGSYVRPHRHADPGRWECFAVLSGAAVVLTFDETGRVLERCELAADGPCRIAEIPAGAWHTLAALRGGTVLFELKQGPYVPLTDKNFAAWAPAEGEPACADFIAWFARAEPGSSAPTLTGP